MKPLDTEDVLLTIEEAANRLRLHVDTARRFVREGKLPAMKIEGRYVVPQSGLKGLSERGFYLDLGPIAFC